MLRPSNPENERTRLNNLRRLAILDTDPEERFDRVTRLARRIFDVPIALVSIVDENRQWFKSCFGLPVSQTPRDVSFCGHAILDTAPFIIEDASKDPRFSDNPLVEGDPYIRFYAGIPLVYDDDTTLGTLCIIDDKPRILSDEEINDLVDLAKMAESELSASRSAEIDELTKVSNRRGFINLADKALNYCKCGNYPYSIVFIDLDKFKLINDNYGHKEGDIALKSFADLMRNSFREMDVFARIGGDEFVIFMAGSTEVVAETAMKRFSSVISEHNQNSNKDYQLSFSYGIATGSAQTGDSIEALIDEADRKMYTKKKEC